MAKLATAARSDKRTARWERTHTDLRRRILTCALPPGTTVSEIVLAREYGISPTPVREALARLRQEGLVVPGAGRGYRVAPLRLSEMKQLAELRAILETGVVRLVAVRARPNDLATLRELARFERSQAFNGAELIRRNRFFHLHLSRLAANAPLTAAIARLFDDCERLFYLGITALPTEEMEATHLRLVDALERHDIDTAEAICEKEAHDTTERVLRALLRYESSSTIPALALIGDEEPSSEDQHAHRMPSPGPGRARKTR